MKFRRTLCACLVALMMVILCAPAMAKVPSPSKEFYYLDQADVLSRDLEGEIFFSNQLLEEACGAQIVVVTVNSTGGEEISDYAYEIINGWGIGSKEKQNGFLLLLSIKDDDYYAVCGTNLQPKFTSGTLKQYFDDYLETDFAAKNYDAGVKKFFEAAFARIADIYGAKVTTAQGIAAYEAWAAQGSGQLAAQGGGGSVRTGGDDDSLGTFGTVAVILVIILIALLISRSRRRVYYGGPRVSFFPVFFGGHRRTPPPPPPAGGYRGAPGAGGYRGTPNPDNDAWRRRGTAVGMGRSTGGGSGLNLGSFLRSSGGSSRSSGGGFRSSGGSFGGARGGGGGSRGGGAGRGRH